MYVTLLLGYPQYPYMPAMVAQYYGYPYPPQYYPVSNGVIMTIQFVLGSSKSKRYQ